MDAIVGPVLEDLPLPELQNALSVYNSDLLPGFYDDWIVLERDRLLASYGSGMELLLVRLVPLSDSPPRRLQGAGSREGFRDEP